MKYWDASAIIPLLMKEEPTDKMSSLIQEDPVMVSWWGTVIECFSAVERLRRMGEINEDQRQRLKEKLDSLALEIDVISPTKRLKEKAIRLLALHPLKAGDALQLASALRWVQDQTHGAGFVCLDEKLCIAARAEGFHVYP